MSEMNKHILEIFSYYRYSKVTDVVQTDIQTTGKNKYYKNIWKIYLHINNFKTTLNLVI